MSSKELAKLKNIQERGLDVQPWTKCRYKVDIESVGVATRAGILVSIKEGVFVLLEKRKASSKMDYVLISESDVISYTGDIGEPALITVKNSKQVIKSFYATILGVTGSKIKLKDLITDDTHVVDIANGNVTLTAYADGTAKGAAGRAKQKQGKSKTVKTRGNVEKNSTTRGRRKRPV